MDKEELNEDIIDEVEEIDNVEELTEEEGEETTGGGAGYGNVQFTCQCGKKFQLDRTWIVHALKYGCRKGTTYQQKTHGKLSQGNKIGGVNSTIIELRKDKKFARVKYPNGKKSKWYNKDGWELVN